MHNRRFAYFAWLTVILIALTSIANAGAYTAVIAYGDSLSDNGNLWAATGQPLRRRLLDTAVFPTGHVTVEQSGQFSYTHRCLTSRGAEPSRASATTRIMATRPLSAFADLPGMLTDVALG